MCIMKCSNGEASKTESALNLKFFLNDMESKVEFQSGMLSDTMLGEKAYHNPPIVVDSTFQKLELRLGLGQFSKTHVHFVQQI